MKNITKAIATKTFLFNKYFILFKFEINKLNKISSYNPAKVQSVTIIELVVKFNR